jgi:hypothetical protein
MYCHHIRASWFFCLYGTEQLNALSSTVSSELVRGDKEKLLNVRDSVRMRLKTFRITSTRNTACGKGSKT